MYSLNSYGSMLKDRLRMDAYQEALRRAVKPGAVVLDIGTGTGVHALMAARSGAKHVYAVEPAESVVLGPRIARANGFEDRISFIQDLSTKITLPERADVIVSDLHGTMPWYQAHIPAIVDARRRLMKDGGILIPRRDVVHMALVEAPELYSAYVDPWRERPYGFDMEVVASLVTNNYSRGRIGEDGFLSEPRKVAELDYHLVEDPNVSVALDATPVRAGTLHGLLVWFDTELLEDVRLTSAPFEPEISYGSAFFPLTEPIPVRPDDGVHVEWEGILHAGDYVWTWSCDVVGADGADRASFRQSSFQGRLLSLDRLRKRVPSFRPRRREEGEIDRSILELMDGERTVEEIARELEAAHPEAFPSHSEALERVRSLSERYA